MDYATYEVEAQIEATHWWFKGRRRLFQNVIRKLSIRKDADILDIGTSTGTNLRMLRDAGFSNVEGLDLYEEAIHWCAEKGLGIVTKGDICNIPKADNSFDLVLATDIIEHVDDDILALQEIYRILKPGGHAIITVPAFNALWGLQDTVSRHKRRYRKKELLKKISSANLATSDSFYFNYILFLPIYFTRKLIDFFNIQLKSENELNSGLANKILNFIFFLDITSAKWIRPFFGVSIFALAKKPSIQN